MSEEKELIFRVGLPAGITGCKLGKRPSPHPKVTLKEILTEGKEPTNYITEEDYESANNIRVWSQNLPGGFPSNLIVEWEETENRVGPKSNYN